MQSILWGPYRSGRSQENNVWSIVNTDYAEELWNYFGAEVVEMTLVLQW
jgi:hypothetical protein